MTYLTEQLARMREQIRNLSRDKVTYREAEVTAVDTVGSTFTAVVPDTAPLAGIASPPQFLPAVGDTVRLTLYGATAIYEPGSIAENAITTRELDDTINAAIDEAVTNAAIALESAGGGNAIVFATTIPNVPGGTVGDIWWQRSVPVPPSTTSIIVGSWIWDGDSWEATSFGDSVFDTISAGKIVTGQLGVGVTIYVGDPAGDHTRLSSNGLVAYGNDPVDGIPNEIARFGRNSGTTSSVTGQRTSTLDEDGNLAVNNATVNGLTVGGVDFAGMFDRFAKGLLTFWDTGKLQAGIVLEFGLLETGYTLTEGRNYRLHVNWWGASTENDGEVVLQVRRTTNGSQPTASSPLAARRNYTMRVGVRPEHRFFDVPFQVPVGAGGQYRWLLTLSRGIGQAVGSVSAADTPSAMHLYDDGPFVIKAGVNDNTGSGSTGTTPKVRNVYSTQASWSRSFRGDGTIRTDTTDMVQGYYAGTGDGKAMFGWPDLTSTLSGATIESVKLYIYNYLWYDNSGGTLILGTHAQTAAPASFSGTSNRKTVAFGPAPSQQWIDVTSWASEFAAGTTLGFVLGPSGGTNRTYYGRFVGAADTVQTDLRPRLEIVYYK